jgi:hypothetical protein
MIPESLYEVVEAGHGGKKAIKVGIVLGFPIEDVKQSFLDAEQLAIDEATEIEVIDREVEQSHGVPDRPAHGPDLLLQSDGDLASEAGRRLIDG